jgi:bifunctional non-homologous end joining protein LigD
VQDLRKAGTAFPCAVGARYIYDQVNQFAEILAHLVHRQLPGSTSLVRTPALRRPRVYMVFLQNRRGKTLAAPYSNRPYPSATASTPLRWREVTRILGVGEFTVPTTRNWFDKLGDVWRLKLGEEVDLTACLRRLTKKLRPSELMIILPSMRLRSQPIRSTPH